MASVLIHRQLIHQAPVLVFHDSEDVDHPAQVDHDVSAAVAASRLKRQAASSPLLLAAADPRARYTLHKELHESIYGKVYLGTDETTGKPVAIKVSVRRLLDSNTSLSGVQVLENPRAEVKVMRQIKYHPNVVSLVAVHEDADLHWMAQEFVGGGELYGTLTASPDGFFKEDKARSVFSQLISGLGHIHQQGVVHLDISLENILVDSDASIKICDFGLARLLPADGTAFTIKGENRPGKLGYMAPEVLAGHDFDGVKADIFSAGVVLFTLLTGHPPFDCTKEQRYEMIAQGRLYELIRLVGMTSRMSLQAADLLSRMLHPDPERRISVEQIAAHAWMQAAQA